jgi:hypothetical protein
MKIQFIKLDVIVEFLPAITWYRWGYSQKWQVGSLTFAWLIFAIKIYYHPKK